MTHQERRSTILDECRQNVSQQGRILNLIRSDAVNEGTVFRKIAARMHVCEKIIPDNNLQIPDTHRADGYYSIPPRIQTGQLRVKCDKFVGFHGLTLIEMSEKPIGVPQYGMYGACAKP
jgi:hypothetical protein